MTVREDIFLARVFKEYYIESIDTNIIRAPPKLVNREFAFQFWNIPGMTRHVKINEITDLKRFLRTRSFQHIYRSGAYYDYPDGETMAKKYRRGTDFLIDIDADHFDTPCKIDHDTWQCESCGRVDVGLPPETCKCGKSVFNKFTWICEKCLDAAKREVTKFYRYFLSDLHIPLDKVAIKYSGNRGYHIVISSDEYIQMNQLERREIVDYLTANGIDFIALGIDKMGRDIKGPRSNSYGWEKYIYEYLYQLIDKSLYGSLDTIGLPKPKVEEIISNREPILKKLEAGKLTKNDISPNVWLKLILYAIDRIKIELDIQVSVDLHRLIRFENSLHGKTGFIAKTLKFTQLQTFNPFTDAIAFSDESSLVFEIGPCPKFQILNTTYGPFTKPEKVEMPLPAAVFALCKRVARLI